ncbi:Obg-like ATPase 1 [Vitis vinifera]|nr:Obg-like ATPase 1 [Vitis vinifera]
MVHYETCYFTLQSSISTTAPAMPITKPTVPHPVSSLITQPAHQYCNHAVASSPVIINRIFSVMKFDDLKELGSEGAVKAAGKYRQEGKTYVVQDADIIFFKFNVSGGGKK